MKKKVILFAIAASLLTSSSAWANDGSRAIFKDGAKAKKEAFKEEKRSEKSELKKSLEGKTPEEKKQALKNFKDETRKDRKDLQSQLHEERLTTLKDVLSKDSKLTDAQKKVLIERHEKEYQEKQKYHEGRRKGLEEEVRKIESNPKLTAQEKREALRVVRQEQQRAAEEYRKVITEAKKNKKG